MATLVCSVLNCAIGLGREWSLGCFAPTGVLTVCAASAGKWVIELSNKLRHARVELVLLRSVSWTHSDLAHLKSEIGHQKPAEPR